MNSNDSRTITLVPRQIPMDQQQQQQQQQHQQTQQQPELPQYTTLSNLSLPDQSAGVVLSLDQSANGGSLSLAAGSLNVNHQHPHNHHQTLVAPGNVAMMQPQLQVDQVPSPSFSTSSSHTSESSYESYESLGSLEEDLQDISNWITELCNSAQDIHSQGM